MLSKQNLGMPSLQLIHQRHYTLQNRLPPTLAIQYDSYKVQLQLLEFGEHTTTTYSWLNLLSPQLINDG